MHSIVSVEHLKQALANTSRIASSKSTLPILANVLVKAENNHLYISATDLTIGLQVFVGAKVVKNGAVTVPARVFSEYINNLQDDTVEIVYEDNKVVIKTKNHHTTLGCLQADDFPDLPTVENGQTLTLPSNLLRIGIEKTLHSTSSDTTKPILNSIFIHTSQDTVAFAATDGYRLSEYTDSLQQPEQSFNIPNKSASELLRILPEEKDVTIKITPQLIEIETAEFTFVTRLMEGVFPKYKALIPTTLSNTVIVDKKELINSIKLASIFAREQAGSTTLLIDEETQQLIVKTQATQTGQNISTLPAKIKGNADITINSRFISDALQHINEGVAEIGFNEKQQPCVVRGKENKNHTQIIMPLKS